MSEMDCQSCGACCKFAGEVVVNIGDTTPLHLTRSVRNVMGFASYEAEYLRRMARTAEGTCKALKGEIGGCVSCRIYARRPAVCRDFEPGSRECMVARKQAGVRAALASEIKP